MRKLHNKIQIPWLTLGFHFLGKNGSTYAMFEKKYDPDICHFFIVLHDQCARLYFEYP